MRTFIYAHAYIQNININIYNSHIYDDTFFKLKTSVYIMIYEC